MCFDLTIKSATTDGMELFGLTGTLTAQGRFLGRDGFVPSR